MSPKARLSAALNDSAMISEGRRAMNDDPRRTALVVTLILLALGILGGSVAYAMGSGVLAPAPVATVTSTTTSTPTPTVAPTKTSIPTPDAAGSAVDPSDPSTWTIDFNGVGPVALGSSFETQRDILPSFTDVTDSICSTGYLDLKPPNQLTFIFMRPEDGSDVTAGIEFGNLGSKLRDDRPNTPRTEAGIGIGSTLQELQTAYPTIQQTGTYGDIVTYYGITDGNGAWIVFRVMDGAVTDIQIAHEALVPIENGSVKTMPHERCPA